MANIFDQFDSAEGNVFDQFDETGPKFSVQPGDVEARRRQVAEQEAAETRPSAMPLSGSPNQVGEALSGVLDIFTGRPSRAPGKILRGTADDALTMLKSFGEGAERFASGISDIAAPLPKELSLKAILSDPRVQTAGGLAEMIAAPLAPASNLITRGAETAADMGLPAPLAGALWAAGQVALPGNVFKQAQVAKPGMKAAFASNRSKAMKLEEELKENLTRSNAEINALRETQEGIAPARDTALLAREDALQAEAQRAAKEAVGVRSNIAAAKESVESIAEAEKAQLPSATQLRERFAANAPLGADVGESFKTEFSKQFKESSQRFNKEYQPLYEEGAKIETTASNYLAAGGVLEKPKGITGFGKTRPEGLAAQIKARLKGLDDADFENDTYEALKKQMDAAPIGDKARQQAVLDEFVQQNKIPERPTVADLMLERKRLKAGKAALRDDNSRRQMEDLIGALEEDIAVGSTPLAERLFATDTRYATEHARYFSPGAVTRAIAEGQPNRVVDSIYKPTVSASGKALSNKSVETMERARELIKDPKQWEQINKAFINKGVEHASEGGTFSREKFVKWFRSYGDPTGTGNQVLKLGLGKDYADIESVVKQLENVKSKTIDEFAAEMTKGFETFGAREIAGITARSKEAREGLRREMRGIRREATQQTTAVGRQVKEATTAQKAMVQGLEKQIKDLMGKNWNVEARLEGIGSGMFMSGLATGDLVRASKGGWVALGSHALGKLLEKTKGRSLFKAMARATPGTSQAAAIGRQIETYIKSLEGAEE